MRAALGIDVHGTRIDATLVDADVPEMGPFDRISLAAGENPLGVAATAIEVMTARARRVGVPVVAAGITSNLDPVAAVNLELLADHARWATPPGTVVLTCPTLGTDDAHPVDRTGSRPTAATRVALLAAAGAEPTPPTDSDSPRPLRIVAVAAALLLAAVLLAWSLLQGLGGGKQPENNPVVDHPAAPVPTDDCPDGDGVLRLHPGRVLGISTTEPGPGPTTGSDPSDPCLRHT